MLRPRPHSRSRFLVFRRAGASVILAGLAFAACATPQRVDAPSAASGTTSGPAEKPPARADVRPAAEARLDAAPAPSAPAPPRLVLPDDFETLPPARFERALEAAAPLDARRSIAPAELARLERTLSAGGDRSLRAALLLARARDARGLGLLLARLEARDPSSDDAPALVAARALASEDGPADAPARLLALARGKNTHPRFSVRAECAASAALRGRDDALPILLDVLRAGAVSALPSPRPSEAELEAAQSRAARVLEERLGVRVEYTPESGAPVRAAEIARLEALLSTRAR